MKNIPRIFVGDGVRPGVIMPIERDIAHYLSRVMRTNRCLVFGGGAEFNATLNADGKTITVGDKTAHIDPTNDIVLYFAPIKRTDDLINMATQMGVRRFQPVVTEHTTCLHINWMRMKKIAIEASEQSNRNSVPEISDPVNFSVLNLQGMCFADERLAYDASHAVKKIGCANTIFIGPEGGFSDSEFAAFDAAGATPVSLGNTILRAEVAAVIAIEKIRQ